MHSTISVSPFCQATLPRLTSRKSTETHSSLRSAIARLAFSILVHVLCPLHLPKKKCGFHALKIKHGHAPIAPVVL